MRALNNAAQMKTNFIIILNDNEMSISENVGGLSTYLSNLRTADAYTGLKAGLEKSLNRIPVYGSRMVEKIRMTKNGIKQLIIPGMFFEDLGIKYLGPLDGHNIAQMVRVFQEARRVNGAVVIHVKTKKGKGYLPAEKHPARFHGAEPFDIETGLPRVKKRKANYTDVFSTVMCKMGAREPRLAAITAAMPDGTGLEAVSEYVSGSVFRCGHCGGTRGNLCGRHGGGGDDPRGGGVFLLPAAGV